MAKLTRKWLELDWNNTDQVIRAEDIPFSETQSIKDAITTGDGKNGGAWFADVVPTGEGNVGGKQTSSDGVVLDECLSDTLNVTIHVLALPGITNYKPSVKIYVGDHPVSGEGIEVPLTEQADSPLFKGSVAYTLVDEQEFQTYTVEHEDGAWHTMTVERDIPPVITNAYFTGGYPGTQTELKENDTFDLFVDVDKDVVAVQIDNYGAFKAGSFSVTEGQTHTVTGTIADGGTTTQNLGARVRVQKSSGSWSDWYLTENDGAVDGTNLVALNNTYPSITFGTVTYPGSQLALKNAEEATVQNTVTNFNEITYDSPNSQLTIDNTTTYETNKNVTRLAGDYNTSTNNFRIVATRTANDATTTNQRVVAIANVLPTITINGINNRLRSGGNDGTSAQDYTITIASTQHLLQAPTLNAPEGTWQGTGFTGAGGTWNRDLRVHDNDDKGTYTLNSLSAVNLSNMEQTTISGNADYTLGGFVSRNITLEAFANEAVMNVAATNYNNVSLSWSGKSSVTNREPVGTDVPPPIPDAWCLVTLNTNPTTIRILDTAATDSVSQASTITIQETA